MLVSCYHSNVLVSTEQWLIWQLDTLTSSWNQNCIRSCWSQLWIMFLQMFILIYFKKRDCLCVCPSTKIIGLNLNQNLGQRVGLWVVRGWSEWVKKNMKNNTSYLEHNIWLGWAYKMYELELILGTDSTWTYEPINFMECSY